MAPNLPSYDELPLIDGLDIRHAWDVFGRDDTLGSINLLTDERVTRAATLVRTGRRISLDLPLNVPDPPLFGRQPFDHVVFPLNRNEMDDRVDNLHLQGSTQWDALNHVRCREHGYWGGRTQDPTEGPNELGIHHWVAKGIAGRGLLIDVAVDDPLAVVVIDVDDLEAALDRQDITPEPGDIWCVRTGWPRAYLALDADERVAYSAEPRFAGLRGTEAMARFLWNHHPGALCCDNPAVEVVPGNPAEGSLHRRMIPALGLAFGEMFDFETLTEACRADDRSTFFFTAAPLHIPNALGSPGNALAIL